MALGLACLLLCAAPPSTAQSPAASPESALTKSQAPSTSAPATGPAVPPSSTSAPAAGPAPESPSSPPNDKVQVSGLFDFYYLYQFNHPRFRGVPNTLGFPRVYDVRHNVPTLALAELNVFKSQ